MKIEEVLQFIETADGDILLKIIGAVLRRSDRLHPGSEAVLLLLPYEAGERKRVLEGMREHLAQPHGAFEGE